MKKYIIGGTCLGIFSLTIQLAPFLSIPIIIIGILAVIIFLMGGFNALVLGNNEKEGYYAQYGESFGTNADKHEEYLRKQKLYIEDRIANEVMKGK